MTLLTARRLVDLVIILLILSYLISWVEGLSLSIASILMALVYLLSYRMARQSIDPNMTYYIWMWVPTILFVVAPVIWSLMVDKDYNLFTNLLLALPLFSLILPVGLLFIVRAILVRHCKN